MHAGEPEAGGAQRGPDLRLGVVALPVALRGLVPAVVGAVEHLRHRAGVAAGAHVRAGLTTPDDHEVVRRDDAQGGEGRSDTRDKQFTSKTSTPPGARFLRIPRSADTTSPGSSR